MKVNTDGVVLGASAGLRPSDRRILDIGTGTGIIALMLAQRLSDLEIMSLDLVHGYTHSLRVKGFRYVRFSFCTDSKKPFSEEEIRPSAFNLARTSSSVAIMSAA